MLFCALWVQHVLKFRSIQKGFEHSETDFRLVGWNHVTALNNTNDSKRIYISVRSDIYVYNNVLASALISIA